MPRTLTILALLLTILLTPALLEAQPNCRRGKPCGRTCISRDKVCRIGTSSSTTRTSPPATTRAPAAVPEGMQFVASSRGRVYYWVGCSAWRDLTSSLRWFPDRAAAEAAGLSASRQTACRGPSAPIAAAAPTAPTGPIEPVEATAPCTVNSIVDGDTLDCADGRRIRLLLIDAPEMDQGAFGPVAKQALETLAPPGRVLQVETDIDLQDRYDRLLAYLHLADGRIVNEELLRRGVAIVSVYPPNVKHVDRFRAASDSAKVIRAGLWALDAFECTPEDHRAGKCEL